MGDRLVFAALLLVVQVFGRLVFCQESTPQGIQLTLADTQAGSLVSLTVNRSKNIPLVIGRSFAIRCMDPAGGSGSVSEEWLRGETPVMVVQAGTVSPTTPSVHAVVENSDSVLVLQLFRESDVGTYTCRGGDRNVSLVISTGNPVVIALSPILVVPSGVQQGSSRPTLATFTSGFPLPTVDNITFFFNGSPTLPSGLAVLEFDLIFPNNVLPSYAGMYTAEVTTVNGTARDTFEVIVTTLPSPSISPTEVTMPVNGTPVTLMCEDSAGVPTPGFRWAYTPSGGSEMMSLTNGSRVTITSSVSGSTSRSTLVLNPVMPGDSGEYRCIAETAYTSNFATTNIEVLFAPIVEPHSTQLRWLVGSTAILQTRLVAANPDNDITVRWLDPTFRTISRSNYNTFTNETTRVYELILPNLSKSSGGLYRCELQNSIRASRLTFDLFVLVPPTLQHVDGTTGRRTLLAKNRASQIILMANVSNARPELQSDDSSVTWTYEGMPITSGRIISTVSSTQVNLTIVTVSMEDTGLYVVTIDHEAGAVSLEFQLEVLDAPNPPTILNSTPLTACETQIDYEVNTTVRPRMAPPTYVVIEASLMPDGAAWVPVGRSDDITATSLRGVILSAGENTMYWLRARSGNDTIGEGVNSAVFGPLTAYTEDFFPFLDGVQAEPAANSSTIRVSWPPPSNICFNFTYFTVTCTPLEGSSIAHADTVTEGATSAFIYPLAPDTFHNCSVEVTFERFARTTTTFVPQAVFTFPPKPPPLGDPKPVVDKAPTSTTITVEFTLPADLDSISHYRVYALRLSQDSRPEGVSSDDLFPTDSDPKLSTYEKVNVDDPFQDAGASFIGYIAAEVAAVGFNPLFTIGDKSQTDSDLFANEGLRPGSIYTFFLRAYPKTRGDSPSDFRAKRQGTSSSLSGRQYVVFTSSTFSRVTQTDPGVDTGGNSPATERVAIGVGVAVFISLLVIGLVVFIVSILVIRAARSRSYRPDRMPSVDNSPSTSCDGTPDFLSIDTPDLSRKINGGHELKDMNSGNFIARSPFVPSPPVLEQRFAEHVEMFDSNRQLLFQEEYEWISNKSPWNPAEASNHILNDEKNRYSNITAFDHSRVELEPVDGVECSDYINANFISGYHSEQEYISTQGPLDQTVVDFWRMVWEQNTATIIMLTNLVELGKVKCAQYWPTADRLIYGNLKVTLESSVNLPNYTIRNLTVEHMVHGESRTVLQFHYTCWPDYGTPKLAAPLLNFLRAVNSSNPEDSGPVIVHCSAGVGRSGTVIAIDNCLHQLKAEGIIDIRAFVSRMREQRNYMVQTAEQYRFIHYAVLESITYGDTSFALDDFTSLYEKLREVNPESKKTLMDEEYGRLGQVKTMVKRSAFQKRLKRKGQPPRHFESSFRGTMPSMESADNYSGHFVDGYFDKKRFIVAEGPQESTTAKFWQVVWDEDCCLVVMLTPQDSELLYTYWPPVGEHAQYGNIIVEVENESEEHFYTKRQIKLTNAKVGGISHTLDHYQFKGWMEDTFPRVPDFVKFVCDVLSEFENEERKRKMLMHDTDSLGPAGIMCALCYCVERLGVERMVDIFQAVQCIQLQRPGSIKTMQQYAFTYDCVYEYIRTYPSS